MAARQMFLLLLLAAAAHAGSTAPTEALFTFDTDSPPLEGIPVVAHPSGKLVFTGAVSAIFARHPPHFLSDVHTSIADSTAIGGADVLFGIDGRL